MASFPSRHIRQAFSRAFSHRRKRQSRHAALGSVLGGERLEQRTMMAADCCLDAAPLFADWTISAEPYDSWSAFPADAALDEPPCYAPPMDPEVTPPAEVDFWDTAEYKRFMADMAAEAEADARRQAEEEARRQADMLAEMAAFFARYPWLDGGDAAADPTGWIDIGYEGSVAPETSADGYVSDASSWSPAPGDAGSAESESDAVCGPSDISFELAVASTGGDTFVSDEANEVPVTPGEMCLTSELSYPCEMELSAWTESNGVMTPWAPTPGFADSVPDLEPAYEWDADQEQRRADEDRERQIDEASELATAMAIAREEQSACGGMCEDQWADEPYVPATDWATMGQPTITVSGVSPQQHPLPLMEPFSLTDTDLMPMPSQPDPPTDALTPQMELAIVTSGVLAPRVAPESKWTALDREAALRAEMAYAFSMGGLLADINVGYNADDPTNAFVRSGMSAMLTRSPETGIYYLAFRGTESLLDGNDLRADFVQALGMPSAQYDAAIELARRVREALGPNATIVLAGHSLGGGLAAAAAYNTGLNAVTFNPASVGGIYSQGDAGYIRSHVIEGDFLSVGRALVGRTAPGEIIVHPARTIVPPFQHNMFNFPDY